MSDQVATLAIEIETRRAHERLDQLYKQLDELGGRGAQRAVDGIRNGTQKLQDFDSDDRRINGFPMECGKR